MKILIANNPFQVGRRIASMIKENFDKEFETHLASNGVEILRKYHELQPDILILFIDIAEINGIKVLQAVKREEPSPRVIMLSNYSYDQYRQICMSFGADYYYDRLINLQKIVGILKNINKKDAVHSK